jgi:signal transduction histidine kinase
MPGSPAITPALLAAAAVLVVGFGAYWANPKRPVNRLFFTVSTHVALWLGCLHIARVVDEGLFWVRVAAALGGFFPLHLWLLKESIIHPAETAVERSRRGAIWLAVGMFQAVLSFTTWFVPAHSTTDERMVGVGYYVYVVVGVLAYAAVLQDTLAKMRHQKGIQRLELQILLLGGSTAAVMVIVLMAIGAVLEDGRRIQAQPFVVLLMYGVMVLAITTHRIFDAKHLLYIALQKMLLICTIAASAYVAYSVLDQLFPAALALVGTSAISIGIAAQLSRWLNSVLQLYPGAAEARSRALAAAMEEMRQEPLKEAFVGILRGWSRSEHAMIMAEVEGRYSHSDFALPPDSRIVGLLKELRWATAERLGRERETPDRVALRQLMEEHSLGVMVLSSGPAFNIIVAIGTRATRRPFTYPEVQQLLELASIFQTALARSFLWSKAQRAEQLATVGLLGASVAHEIRNPLVTIKSFVHLLPHHYDDKNFRERFFRLIGEEVGRIDRLTEQLLDLAAPRHYNPVSTSLHQIISTSLELVATKADERHVTLHRDLQAEPDIVFTDPNATRQVLLNLCFNGIQAQDQSSDGRWLKLTTRNVSRGVELCVSDHGPGIPAEARGQLFQAFHSTKSSGFGLGLAICSEILSSLNTTIAVDPFVPGEGAVFRIVFPCPPPTS